MFGFESITVIALDTRLGSLDEKMPPELKQTFDAVQVSILKTHFGGSANCCKILAE